MKNKARFIKEIIITLIVATLISIVLSAILIFILANFDAVTKGGEYVNTVSSSIWGLMVGYKISSLLRESR
jgi:cell shape-determining protein MreC